MYDGKRGSDSRRTHIISPQITAPERVTGSRNPQPQLRCPSLLRIVEQMSREALGNFELMVLLAVLRIGDDAYGVPVARELEEKSGRQVLLGSVYAALDRLEAKGLVKSYMGEPTPERGGSLRFSAPPMNIISSMAASTADCRSTRSAASSI
jgi:hypothetical protein